MFEKVNPSHPDKIADRIAGAIVDLAYTMKKDPKVSVEVLIGHGECTIIVESDVRFLFADIYDIVLRITNEKNIKVNYKRVPQDVHLAENQAYEIKCGDNGLFKGFPITSEETQLNNIVNLIYESFPYDGKYIINEKEKEVIGCQSMILTENLEAYLSFTDYDIIANPLGEWTGGTNVDCGATNRKLGSDMGEAVTGGGLHGKDLSKADVSVNIICHSLAQLKLQPITAYCAIGDDRVTFEGELGYKETLYYDEIVKLAKIYIDSVGGFEKFAEWGLIRPNI